MIAVPEKLADELYRREGDAAREWVRSFPARAEQYLQRWGCTPDDGPRNGAVAVVIPVKSPYGQAIIKISYPHPGNTDEHRALGVWQGDGAAALFDHDAPGFALLLERVQDRQLDVAADEGIVIGGELSKRLAVIAPPGMRRLADTTAEWENQVRDHCRQSAHPLPNRVVDAVIETIRDLGADRTPTMLHGDLHSGNILHSDRGWVVIDPKGMTGPAAYDAMTMVSYRHEELLTTCDPMAAIHRRIRLFSEAAGIDPELSTRCVHARAVSGLLWDLSHGPVQRTRNFALRTTIAEQLL